MQNLFNNIVYSEVDGHLGASLASVSTNSAEPPVTKRARGRPSLGKPIPVVMSDEERAIALRLGDGQIALGVRRALHLANAAVQPKTEAKESKISPVSASLVANQENCGLLLPTEKGHLNEQP